MNNKCMHFRAKSKKGIKYFYCNKHKKEITLSCKCEDKEYKQYKKMKKTTSGQRKKERKRFSIIYEDMTRCACCNATSNIHKNEVYEGCTRSISMKHGFVVPLCNECHIRFHNDYEFALYYKRMFQEYFEQSHSHDEFMKLIHRNYL